MRSGWSAGVFPWCPKITEPADLMRSSNESLIIDCDQCVMQHTHACDDCVVTFLCSEAPAEAVVVDVAEARALRLLADSGLAPPLRLRRRTG